MEVSHCEQQMIIHGDPERLGGKAVRLRGDRNTAGTGLREHRPGRIFWYRIAPPHAHPQDIVAQRIHLQRHPIRNSSQSARCGCYLLAESTGWQEQESEKGSGFTAMTCLRRHIAPFALTDSRIRFRGRRLFVMYAFFPVKQGWPDSGALLRIEQLRGFSGYMTGTVIYRV
jgi:hypothetical protein